MLNFYINSVKYGYITIDKVPERYRADVEAALAA